MAWRAEVVFSTGGYSAAPIVWAARALGIPYVIHSADSVPAKSSRMFADRAAAFTHVFRSTPTHAPGFRYRRTGHPLRRELRALAVEGQEGAPTVLVVGGSQGSEFLNQRVPEAAAKLPGVRFVHGCGPKNLDSTLSRVGKLGLENYEAQPYFDARAMARAYSESTLVVARSGGTLAEIAMFGLPSILVPLPTSADDHQLHNAREFDAMGAATLLPQPMDPGLFDDYDSLLAQHIGGWLNDEPRRNQARETLREWDIPDATDRIVKLIQQAAK